MICSAFDPERGLVGGLLDYIDCQTRQISVGGYEALAAPGSGFALVLTGLLTILTALLGYRMVLGYSPTVRDGVGTMIKVGVVLMLATSWPVYRTLVYDVVLYSPAQIAADLGGAGAIPGAGGGLVARLDDADAQFVRLAVMPVGSLTSPDLDGGDPAPAVSPSQQGAGEQSDRLDGTALEWGRILFVTGAAGSLGAVRLIAAVALGIGPLFIALLLFAGTRGFFVGWLRVLACAVVASAAVALVLGVELAFLEPRLDNLRTLREARLPAPGLPTELAMIALVFGFALIAVLVGSVIIAGALRWPSSGRVSAVGRSAPRLPQGADPVTIASFSPRPLDDRSRPAMIVDSIRSTQRREAAAALAAVAPSPTGSPVIAAAAGNAIERHAPMSQALGQSRRRTSGRTTQTASRRDRRA